MTTPFASFLDGLVRRGEALLSDRPDPDLADAEARALLARLFGRHALDVAGPRLAPDVAAAIDAGAVLWWAAWLCIERLDPIEPLERAVARLHDQARAPTPSRHLSVDLTFRLLPAIHRRSRAIEPGARLPALLEQALRAWPLSGVLADTTAPPTGDLGFAGHPGLVLLYEERLAANDRPAWRKVSA